MMDSKYSPANERQRNPPPVNIIFHSKYSDILRVSIFYFREVWVDFHCELKVSGKEYIRRHENVGRRSGL